MRRKILLLGVVVTCLWPVPAKADSGSPEQGSLLLAQDRPSAAGTHESQPEPSALPHITAMVNLLTHATHLTYRADTTVKMGPAGSLEETQYSYTVSLERPGKVSILAEGPNAVDVVCDGTHLLGFNHRSMQWSQEAAPATADDAILAAQTDQVAYFALSFALPEIRHIMLGGTTQGAYAGLQSVDEIPAHRLHFEQPDMLWDLWVRDGDSPEPLQLEVEVVPATATYKGGQTSPPAPTYTWHMIMKFSGWSFDRPLPTEAFTFTPPEGAEHVFTVFERKSGLAGKAVSTPALPRLDDGEVKLSDHVGKDIVVLDFWATWCNPCPSLVRRLSSLVEQYKDQRVVLYAVNWCEDPKLVRSFLQSQDLGAPVLLDADGAAGRQFGVEGVPVVVTIGRDGKVQAVHHRCLDANFDARVQRELDALVSRESSAPAPPPSEAPPATVR